MVNFTLPAPEVDPDEPNVEERIAQQKSMTEQKVKNWLLRRWLSYSRTGKKIAQ